MLAIQATIRLVTFEASVLSQGWATVIDGLAEDFGRNLAPEREDYTPALIQAYLFTHKSDPHEAVREENIRESLLVQKKVSGKGRKDEMPPPGRSQATPMEAPIFDSPNPNPNPNPNFAC